MKLFCETQGNEHGPALLMTHGVFGSHDNLGAITRLLAKDFHLYRIDLRNHGRSPHADTMTYAEMAADMLELMDANNLDTAAVLGHSLGGKVMMELACTHPHRINHLIVGDIAPIEYPPHHDPILDGLQAIDLSELKSRGEADEQLQAYVEELPTRQFLLKNLQRDEEGNYYWRLNLPVIVKEFSTMRSGIAAGKVFDGPTLFIRGGLSKYIRERNFDAIKNQFPNSRIETIENASHWLHAEEPQQFAHLATAFLLGE